VDRGTIENNFQNVWQYLENSGCSPSVSNGVIRSACPFHNGENITSFMYNPDNDIYRCWSCGITGKWDDTKIIVDIKPEKKVLDIEKKLLKRSYNINNKIMEIYRKDPYVPAILSRCNNKDLIDFAEIGHLEGEIMFPYFDKDGLLLGYKVRMVNRKSFYTVGETSSTFFMFKQAYEIINSQREIVITEGEWDALKCWDSGICNAVGIGGCSLSNKQIQILFSLVDSVVLFLDNDDAGKKATKKIYNELNKYCNVYVIDYREKDPDLIASKKAMYNYYKNKIRGKDWNRRN
jgi:5S rRNA maturation endonuclease (ribonuclease M5)